MDIDSINPKDVEVESAVEAKDSCPISPDGLSVNKFDEEEQYSVEQRMIESEELGDETLKQIVGDDFESQEENDLAGEEVMDDGKLAGEDVVGDNKAVADENEEADTEYVAEDAEYLEENLHQETIEENVMEESAVGFEGQDLSDVDYHVDEETEYVQDEHDENQSPGNGIEEAVYVENEPDLQTSEEILEDNGVDVGEDTLETVESDEGFQNQTEMSHAAEEYVEEDDIHDASFEEVNYEDESRHEEIIQQDGDELEVQESAEIVDEDVHEEAIDEQKDVQEENMEENRPSTPLSNDEIEDVDDAEADEPVQLEEGDDDYDDAVEVEESKEAEDEEDENVAQHESGSDSEQEEVAEDSKLDQMNNYDDSDSNDDDNEENDNAFQKEANPSQEKASKMFDSESENEEEKEGDLIADIFGKSDDEDEEFTGFGQDESTSSMKKSLAAVISDSDEDDADEAPKQPYPGREESSSDDEGVRDENKSSEMVYDFDIMLQKKKDERRGRRRRDGGTFISDADDIINAMLTKMKEAAEADREANKMRKPALHKLKMLTTVVRHLRKQDLKEAFVDMGVIAAIADWLSLLPDRSLPHITIRSELLAILHDLPPIMPETLKSSGIGRAVMMVFKHPKETRKNKESAGRLINKWTRPIFGLNDNFKSMSRGEREQRDLEQMPQSKRRRLSSGRSASERGEEGAQEPGQLRPGERGFVMRARVPKPSNKDYVIRPKWNVAMDDEEGTSSRMMKRNKSKKDERLEKHLKTFAERKKNLKMQRAVGISLEGNKMPLS